VQNKLIHFIAHEKKKFLIYDTTRLGQMSSHAIQTKTQICQFLAKKNLIKTGHIIHQNARQNTTNTMGVVKIDLT
jgi:hypothetical protein